jgi:hypothetical protein
VTVDLDGFDPSIMPATGTPEPRGLSWFDVTRLPPTVGRHCTVIGADITELAGRRRAGPAGGGAFASGSVGGRRARVPSRARAIAGRGRANSRAPGREDGGLLLGRVNAGR